MRWFLIDRFISLEKGKRAVALKNVTLGEDHIHDPFPGFPMMPAPLIIESMAQTGGVLAGYTFNFKERVILAKVDRAIFHDFVLPGDQMRLEAKLVEIRQEGCRIEGTVTVEGRKIAEISLIFAHLASEDPASDNFVFTREFLSVFLTSLTLEGMPVGSGSAKDA